MVDARPPQAHDRHRRRAARMDRPDLVRVCSLDALLAAADPAPAATGRLTFRNSGSARRARAWCGSPARSEVSSSSPSSVRPAPLLLPRSRTGADARRVPTGALSDSSPSRYRRRQFIIAATAIMLVATFVVAFATALAPGLVVAFVGRDARFDDSVKTLSIAMAIVGVYVLVAAFNAVQASIRVRSRSHLSRISFLSASSADTELFHRLSSSTSHLLGSSRRPTPTWRATSTSPTCAPTSPARSTSTRRRSCAGSAPASSASWQYSAAWPWSSRSP